MCVLLTQDTKRYLVKGGITIAYASILITILFISTSQAYATCKPYKNCDNETEYKSTLTLDSISNSTLSLNQFSNSTSFEDSTLELNLFSNSTVVEGNSSLSLLEKIGISDLVNMTNKTTILHPMELFPFVNKTSTIETNQKNNLGSVLDGNEYLDSKSSVKNLKSFSITAWVKPDYSQGSPIFTVTSDEDAFVLAINNNMPPTKMAIFSIFNGIKWITVQSAHQVPEQWTFLTATFNGTSLDLYVNGSPEGSTKTAAVPVLVNGQLTTRLVQNVISDANVTIGAYYEKVRSQTMNYFSGKISEVNLYDTTLDEKQIDKIYNSTKPEDVKSP